MRQYLYSFHWSDGQTQGSVDVHDHGIALHFPSRTLTAHPTVHPPMLPTCVLSINNVVLFDLHWLPIHTEADFYKCQDMLYRLYYEWWANFPQTPSAHFMYKLYDKQRTFKKNVMVSLDLSEEYGYTYFNVHMTKTGPLFDHDLYPHVSIYCGGSLIFSSQRDLDRLDKPTLTWLLGIIVEKLSHICI